MLANRKLVADLCYRNKLVEMVPALTEDQYIETCVTHYYSYQCIVMIISIQLCRTARVEVMGTTYKTGCCLLIGHHLGLPEFAKLQAIVVHCHEVYLALEVLTTCRFYDHFHSYEVQSSPNPSTSILMPSQLLDFQVLHIHSVGKIELITPKYDIDSYWADRM